MAAETGGAQVGRGALSTCTTVGFFCLIVANLHGPQEMADLVSWLLN